MSQEKITGEFQKAALRKMSFRELDDVEEAVRLVRGEKFQEMIFGSEAASGDLDIARGWLRHQSTKILSVEEKKDVARGLQWLRDEFKFRILWTKEDEPIECTIGTAFQKDRDITRFRIRRLGNGEGKPSLSSPMQLPDTLDLAR